MAARNSAAVITAYNPQEWSRNGPVSGAYMPHSASAAAARARGTRDVTGHEANLPSPPPPYTQTSPLTIDSSQSHHPSPRLVHAATFAGQDQSASTSPRSNDLYATPTSTFPPPPGSHRDRSGSRTRGMFSILSSRNRQSENISSPQTNVQDSSGRQAADGSSRPPLYPLRIATQDDPAPVAPAARRAASAGAAGTSVEQSRQRSSTSRRGNETPWEPGMPLPPPPPGPPPSSRSQSVDRASERGVGSSDDERLSLAAPIPMRIAQLGSIPPTPADWVDEGVRPSSESSQGSRTGLRLNTNLRDSPEPIIQTGGMSIMSAVESGQDLGAAAAARGVLPGFKPARENSTKGIRERRSETRAHRASSKEPKSAVDGGPNDIDASFELAKPANLVLSSLNDGISRKQRVSKAQASPLGMTHNTPGTRGSQPQGVQSTGNTPKSSQGHRNSHSAAVVGNPNMFTPTPPFSGGKERGESGPRSVSFHASANSARLPTPINSGGNKSVRSPSDRSEAGNRSASRLLSSPNADTPQPLTPYVFNSPASANSLAAVVASAKSEHHSFVQESLERHRVFAEKEAAATSDHERLELFAEFIVHESRLRRDRYSEAFESMGSDVLDLTRDLWRTYSTTAKRVKTPNSGMDVNRSTPRPQSREGAKTPNQPQSQPPSASPSSTAPLTPRTDSESPNAAPSQGRHRSDSQQRTNSFQPCLSPIPSMAMSVVTDEEDSRGRASSRWWEGSAENSSVAGAPVRKLERSKRESKYMGLAPEARENLQWDNTESSSPYQAVAGPAHHPYAHLGADEYPPEKSGWHDQDTPSAASSFAYAEQATPQPRRETFPKLDVSRLITLPPPYPRHHPALNNSHPKLAHLRATLRLLNDRGDVTELRERHLAANSPRSARADSTTAIAERRRELRAYIQERVTLGEMTFAEAAKMEAEFDEKEIKKSRELAQKQFNSFQSGVMTPVTAIFTEKINKATNAIDQLCQGLKEDAQTHDPNQTQEEGDEKPELLERVTLLKWLFEAREQLHRELFDFQAESDEKYKQVILAPYRAASNLDKVREVDAFFTKDGNERKVEHEGAALKRYETLLRNAEESIARGVENQLSAFWDIAPPLLAVVQKVPDDLRGFEIQIPTQEYEENPSYQEFPMQYLYSLVSHAEKSAYQFIESQTNQSCLLHEVKTAAMLAGCKLFESQQHQAGEGVEGVEREISVIRNDEDARLTAELKEKVELAENQWREALGEGLSDCKNRIRTFLEEVGGWDDGLEE